MANTSQVQAHVAQLDQAQTRETNANHSGKLRWYGPALMIFAVAVALAVVAITQYRSEVTTVAISHVGDHANMVHMGHLELTEWDVSGLNSVLSDELTVGDSTLEVHNDGQTVHRFAIWSGGVVEGDQVVGGALIAETGYIQPGELTTVDVDLEPGEYVLICSVRGHTARGMHATVKVQ